MATIAVPSEVLKTPLYNAHLAKKAKMVPFGGWQMPVSYESVLQEHRTVRESCGIFDVSHMGEVRVVGPEAEAFLQHISINDVARLKNGGGQYSAMLNDSGGMIDDLIIYRLKQDEFFICVNAANRQKDFDWIKSKSQGFNVQVLNESDQWAQIAIQGPKSETTIAAILNAADQVLLRGLEYTHIVTVSIFGSPSLLARTGYTGEHGYELYLPVHVAEQTWMALLEQSSITGVKPIGLGARDTLRLEACYLLYGNDMNDNTSPLEAGISWATKLDKGNFIGRDHLVRQKSDGVKRRLQAFKMIDDGIPRHGMKVFINREDVGEVTSGSVLPTVGGAGGLVMISSSLKEGDEFQVDIRGQLKKAVIVKKPHYAAKTK